LALTKELVKLMDGEIEVKSRVGTETEFTVMLPIRIEAPQTTVSTDSVNVQHEAARGQTAYQADYAALQRSLSHYQGSSKPLLLVAEVNPDVVAYLASCLSDHYRLTVTKDGREALEMATHTTPDLIISDVMLPYLDGFELTKTLKQDERTSHIPIIMLTAKADMESKLRSLEEGADAYLAKPFNNKELLIRIRKLLELRWQLPQHYLLIAGGRAPAIADYNLEQTEQPENQFIKKARKLVDEHLDDYEFSVEQFCQEIGMSNSQLHRKLTAVTGLSATKFIRHVRLSKAKELLRDPSTSVTAVAYDTGFNDPSYFGRIFKKEFGLTPREWQHHAAEDD